MRIAGQRFLDAFPVTADAQHLILKNRAEVDPLLSAAACLRQ